MKLQTILLALLAFSVPQIGAIETDNCAELAQQLRDEQAKVKELEKENFKLGCEASNLQCHDFHMTQAFKLATVASAISGAGFAVAKTFAPHLKYLLDDPCAKSIAGFFGVYAGAIGGMFSLLAVPDLVSNSLDSRRPAVERFGSLCAALVGIAPAAVAAYLFATGPAGACTKH